MNDTRIYNLIQLKTLVNQMTEIRFKATNKEEAYAWMEKTLFGYHYRKLSKKGKGIIQIYLEKITGYSKIQIKRLCGQFLKNNCLKVKNYRRHRFKKIYTNDDIIQLAKVDETHSVLSGPATKKILEREYKIFSKYQFENLAQISVSHLYNLRHSFTYRQKIKYFTKTQPSKNTLGIRQKPRPLGQPGFIRVDTVHQGDKRDGSKGVYHINFVDEVTQWELMACVQTISEIHLLPIFELILEQFPFIILNFHADNGSEFINKIVVKLLEKLRIKLTKSRPRKHNDNALVETKNGSIVRKHMGYLHIPKSFAQDVNEWYQKWFNQYLNYHRPCGYAKRIVDKKGKEKFIYPQEDYQIPFEKFKLLKNYQKYLKPGITIDNLNKIAYALSDTDFAEEMLKAKKIIFNKIYENIRNNNFTLFE